MRIEDEIGRRVRALRTIRGLTQAQLGRLVDPDQPWPRQAVSAAEGGARAWAIADLLSFARGLDVSLADLIGEDAVSSSNAAGPWPVIDARLAGLRRAVSELEDALKTLGSVQQ